MYQETQMFLIMDHDTEVLPEHIRKTFRLYPSQKSAWESDLGGIKVSVLSENIDLRAGGYVIVFSTNQWHNDLAINLYDQIKDLRKDAVVVMIPVEPEEKRVLSHGDFFNLPKP